MHSKLCEGSLAAVLPDILHTVPAPMAALPHHPFRIPNLRRGIATLPPQSDVYVTRRLSRRVGDGRLERAVHPTAHD